MEILKDLIINPHSWSTFTVYKVFAYRILVDVFSSPHLYDVGHRCHDPLFVAEGLSDAFEVTQLISQGSRASTRSQDF